MQKINSFLLVILFSFIGLAGISAINPKPSKPPMLEMFSRGDSYPKLWRKVDSLQKKGLPESALEVAESIYDKATEDENQGQIVKSLIHILKFTSAKEEGPLLKNIQRLDLETAKAKFPLKPVLLSLQAQGYWNYFQSNSYRFASRTETVDFENEDISTWSLPQLAEKVSELYLTSLASKDSLQRTSIDIYSEILNEGDRRFRPTLYDFIAFRALDFFQNDQLTLTQPAYRFELENESDFLPAVQFANAEVGTKDTASFKYQALLIMKELLNLHLDDEDPTALIDADLIRLRFMRNNSILPDKNDLYLKALENLEEKFPNHPHTALTGYYIATEYQRRGDSWSPADGEEDRWWLKKAHEKANKVLEKFPKSPYGSENCRSLLHRIETKSLNLVTEEANVPGQPFRALISWGNIEKSGFRLVQLSKEQEEKYFRLEQEKMIKALLKLKPLKSWTQELENPGDFQLHSAEIRMPELPMGRYLILTAPNDHWQYNNGQVGVASIWSTNLSYIYSKEPDQTLVVSVMDRIAGTPVEDASVEFLERSYNYKSREYEYNSLGKKKTNAEGEASLSGRPNKSRNIYLDIVKGEDRLKTDQSHYQYNNSQRDSKAENNTHFFLDRAIYRPGQTIYFKGLVVSSRGDDRKIVPNHRTTVRFYDANYQEIAQQELRTNEFGTYHGSFVAPQGVLTGQMHISDDDGTRYFRVEEYKRPKFEVEFNPVAGSYRLNDKVVVTGKAMAYAGSVIDGAEVRYRVVRTARFPWYWGWWRRPFSEEMEIANGKLTTNEKGEYEIEFTAIPDRSLDPKTLPEFTYTVYADVTDISGETHSAETSVRVGAVALSLSTNVPEEWDVKGSNVLRIFSRNLAGEKVSAEGEVSIERLKSPEKAYRKRLWGRPDIFLIKEEAFRKDFPLDLYDREDDHRTWKVDKEVFSGKFDTEKSDSLVLKGLKKWSPGKYKMVLNTEDKFGTKVEHVKYFTVFDREAKSLALPEIYWHNAEKMRAEPGEEASFRVGTSLKELRVLLTVSHKDEIIRREWIQLKKGIHDFSIPIEERYRGNLSYSVALVRNGRFFLNQQMIQVPWTNKQLKLEFGTFRNKLYPGQDEKWTVKISGHDQDKVLAEMVAGMYDASLDEFASNSWNLNVWPSHYHQLEINSGDGFSIANFRNYGRNWNSFSSTNFPDYETLNWFGYRFGYYPSYRDRGGRRGDKRMKSMAAPIMAAHRGDGESEKVMEEISMNEPLASVTGGVPAGYGDMEGGVLDVDNSTASSEQGPKTEESEADLDEVQVRTNLNETAFFFPDLQTNEKGEVILSFTMPEALTRWKFLGLAHTKELETGVLTGEVVTQKDLMVMPHAPRFFRENDNITFTAKISNLSEGDLSGSARLTLLDASTMKEVDADFGNASPTVSFVAKAGQSDAVAWDLTIPEGISALTYRVVAKAGDFSDGEEDALPVLTNRMLVTEAMPLPLRPKQTREFTFEKMVNHKSPTLKNHKFTLEFTSNPAWYAIQALPYLMEYPYECSEQIFSRFYANSIATHVANSHPRIKQVFDAWKNRDKEALLSNLEKNQELKSLLLEETPWVLNAQNESERKKRVGLLFDLNKMSHELNKAMKQLQKNQVANGGWPWFPGMPESRYITQHIVTGMGHLDKLGVEEVRSDKDVANMLLKAVQYLDQRIAEDYEKLRKKNLLKEKNLGNLQIQYLYGRSFFPDFSHSKRSETAFKYYLGQAKKYWLDHGRYQQGMISLALHRFNEASTAKDIIASLKEHSLQDEEMGMYWADNRAGFYWYQAPIETQSLLIEAFAEVTEDAESVEEMKLWLLKQKQTQDWKTTRATTEACYALLLQGTDYLAESELATITVGGEKIDPNQMDDVKVEAGTGYFKTSWMGGDIRPEMGKIKVENPNQVAAWGAVYWQYFEQLDKITFAETPLKVSKELFREEPSDKGPVIRPVSATTELSPGDKVIVRVEIRSDRDLEYVHLKDMRAAGFEPINVLSGYRYQDGLGYYESTRDASTNFFISYLRKGTYVFEYPLRVSHKGDFSNGITSIQCMYAPEFTAHTSGIRVKVVE